MPFPDEWIQVLFSDDTYACIERTSANEKWLDGILESAGGGFVRFTCLDGSVMTMRRNSIIGYVPSTPELRDRSRQFTKERKAEDPDWASE